MENENQDKIISNKSSNKPRPGDVVKPESKMEQKEEKPQEEPKQPETAPETKPQPEQKAKSAPKPEPKPEPKVEPKPEPKPEQPKEQPVPDKPVSQVNYKKIISIVAITLGTLGLAGGGYYVYASGLYKSFLDIDLGMITGRQEVEVEQPEQQEDQQEPQAQQENTRTLDYLEDELNQLEESVVILETNSNLTELLNLEDSEF